MKAAVFYGKEDIRTEEVQIREIGANEVLIDVRACGVCGTDMHIYEGSQGATQCEPPVILGHEFSGVISAVGTDVINVKVGDRVTVDPNIACGKCYACRVGKQHFCEEMIATGVIVNGGFAEQCIVYEKQVFKIADSVSFEEAAMCEPVACCLHGIDVANIQTGDNVLIIGGGAIGLIMMQLARTAGAATVIVSEPVESKRELALKLGADIAIDPFEEDFKKVMSKYNVLEVNVVIECVGLKATMIDAIKHISHGGTVVLFGLTDPDCEIPMKPFDLFRREITIKSSFVNPYTQGRAARLIGTGKINVAELISDVFTLDTITQAFSIKGKNGKMIVKP